MKTVINNWIEHMEVKRFSQQTIKLRISAVKHFITAVSLVSVTQINEKLIVKYLNKLVEKFDNTNSIMSYKASVKVFLSYLHGEELIAKDYRDYLEIKRVCPRVKDIFNDNEVLEIIQFCNDHRSLLIQTFVMLNYALGLRLNELIELKINNLDLNSKCIVFTRKTGKESMLPIPTCLMRQVLKYLEEYRLNQNTDSNYFFIKPNGNILNPVNVSSIYKSIAQDLKLGTQFTPHILRHSIANSLLRRGVNINYLKVFLGHENLETTVRFYLKTDIKELLNIVDKHHFLDKL